jgi:iron complex outermembrane receptor protein
MWVKSAVSVIALIAASSGVVRAQEAAASDTNPTTVVVTGSRVRSLEQFTPTGSRLGLTTRETPATLDIITAGQIEARGFISVEQAASSLPGVTSGGSPGDPASFSMRGFTADQISMLHNGIYVGPSNMMSRPQNTFNLESVEILKGPASVLYGQGAIGGVVNVTNKAPSFGPSRLDFLASAGSFGTTNLGIGGSTRLSDSVAVRGDISKTSTDGYVHGASADSVNATVSLVWKVNEDLRVQVSVDYLNDHPSRYFGTPLVPSSFATDPLKGVLSTSSGYTIDKRMRYVNYNVADSKIESQQYWPQVFVKWTPSDNITVENFAYFLSAKRTWIDAETYSFNTATSQIDRDRFFVLHDQRMWGDQASVKIKGKLFGLDNTFILGLDYSHLDFMRYRGFPDGDSVDPFNPVAGSFGSLLQPGELVMRASPTTWDDTALFFENVTQVTPKLKILTGGRTEKLDLDRKNFNTAGVEMTNGFKRTYSPSTWRIGAVYDLTPNITPYISLTTADDPPGSSVFIVNAGENFALSRSAQAEAGIKGSAADGRADYTLAVYDITRKNFLVPNSPQTAADASETSKGIEATGDFKVTEHWGISANGSYTDATYDDDSSSYAGNRPANVPKTTANLWTSYTGVGGLPLELGGGVKYVGDRYADSANTVKLDSYSLVSLYAAYMISPKLTLTARVNNALDKAYAQWGDVYYPTEVMLGSPRAFELSLSGHF